MTVTSSRDLVADRYRGMQGSGIAFCRDTARTVVVVLAVLFARCLY
jgi:hypothetical protein